MIMGIQRRMLIYHIEVSQGQAFFPVPWPQELRTQPTTEGDLNKYLLNEWMAGGWDKTQVVFSSCLLASSWKGENGFDSAAKGKKTRGNKI